MPERREETAIWREAEEVLRPYGPSARAAIATNMYGTREARLAAALIMRAQTVVVYDEPTDTEIRQRERVEAARLADRLLTQLDEALKILDEVTVAPRVEALRERVENLRVTFEEDYEPELRPWMAKIEMEPKP